LHDKINSGLKTTVKWAIQLGEKLTQAKEKVGHGDFLNWIDNNCNFKRNKAHKYMKCFEYSANVSGKIHLQEAYKEIEQIEYREKLSEKDRVNTLVKEKLKTGKNPDGWTRDCDYAFIKKFEEDELFNERLEKVKQVNSDKTEIRDNKKNENSKFWDEREKFNDQINDIIENTAKDELEKANFRKSVTIDNKRQDWFYDTIDQYICKLPLNEQHEAINGIVKYCRKLSIDMNKAV